MNGVETVRKGSFFSLFVETSDRLRPMRAPTDIFLPLTDQPDVSLTGDPFSLLLPEVDVLAVSANGTPSLRGSVGTGSGPVGVGEAASISMGTPKGCVEAVVDIGARAAAMSSSFMASPSPAIDGAACTVESGSAEPC